MKTKQFIPAATLALAIAFTLNSCGEQNGDNPSSSLCGNANYDPSLYRCEMGEIIGKCMGKDYYTAYQQCVNGVITSSNRSSSSSSVRYSSSSISSAGQISSSSSEGVSSSSSDNSSSSTADNSSSSETTLYCYYESPDNCWPMPTMDDCAYGTLVHDCSKPPEGIYCYYGDGICWLMPTADNCASGTLVNDCSKPPSSSSSVPSSSSSSSYTASSSSAIGCPDVTIGNNTMTCGGQTYRTVKIGEQTWMAENLNYEISSSTFGSCYGQIGYAYEIPGALANCAKYGRLYDWKTAKTVCPIGWHLPTENEWRALIRFVQPSCTSNGSICIGAGTKLKTTSGWNRKSDMNDVVYSNPPGSDDYGFSALPGGEYNIFGSGSGGIGEVGKWWLDGNPYNDLGAWEVDANNENTYFKDFYGHYSLSGDNLSGIYLSVRCMMN